MVVVTESDFLNNYCRVCGEVDGICIDLTTTCEENYLNKVQELLPINIKKDEKLPKNLCHVCISTIDLFDKLKQKCVKTQETLRNLAKSFDQVESEDESSDVEVLPLNNPTSSQDDDVVFIEEKTNSQHDMSIVDSMTTIDVEDYSSSDEKCSQKSTASEPKRQETSPIEEKCNMVSKLDGWTIQRIPGKDTTLYICNNCQEMLLYESAIKSHSCSKESILVTHILPMENNSNQPKEEYRDDDANRKRRKRIYFAGED